MLTIYRKPITRRYVGRGRKKKKTYERDARTTTVVAAGRFSVRSETYCLAGSQACVFDLAVYRVGSGPT